MPVERIDVKKSILCYYNSYNNLESRKNLDGEIISSFCFCLKTMNYAAGD